MNIIIVDLTYFELISKGVNRGSRLLQICKYWTEYNNKITIFSSGSAIKQLRKRLEDYHGLIELKAIPYSGGAINSRYQVIIDYIKKIFFLPFVDAQKDVDVIYTLTGLIPDVLFAFFQKLKNPKIKWVAHVDNLVWLPWKRPGWKKINNFIIYSLAWFSFIISITLIRRADLIFTVSTRVSKGLVGLGLSEDKIRVSSNGIVFKELPPDKEKNEKIFDSVYLGRIEVPKGILDLIEVWHIICKKNKKYKLAIIGGMVEAMQKRLNKKISELNLQNNVEILGFRDGREKFYILNQSRVFIYASYDESFGQSVMEALACGLPVVAYDLDAYREIYPDGLIQVVPIGKIGLFAEKVLYLLENDKLREELSIGGKETVKDKGWDRILESELSIISQLIQ